MYKEGYVTKSQKSIISTQIITFCALAAYDSVQSKYMFAWDVFDVVFAIAGVLM